MLAKWSLSVFVGGVLLFHSTAALSQTNSSIAGAVADATGAVLPGVTVEASSPALIEKTRSAVTDGSGQYRIVELVPGIYTVTFSLPGFSSVRREGVTLTTGFTAAINAELRVGDIAETITVSGQSPVVDTQNVVQQRVMTREIIDAIPTAKNYANLGVLIPGTTVTGYGRVLDVGGSEAHGNQMLIFHGSRATDQVAQLDAMSIGMLEVVSAFPVLAFPDGSTEEINVGTGAHSAEMETGGVRINMIPKSGGNRFTGSAFLAYTQNTLQSSNLDSDLAGRGLTAVGGVDRILDVNPSLGGPVIKDRLWFFGGYRYWRTRKHDTRRFDANPTDWVYTPDLSRPTANLLQRSVDGTGRLTWQASSKDKINVLLIGEDRCLCGYAIGGTTEPLTMPGADNSHAYPSKIGQITWLRPATNRLLLEAGASVTSYRYEGSPEAEAVGPPAMEQSTSFIFRSRSAAVGLNEAYYKDTAKNYVIRGSASYVTGAHALKAGMSLNPGRTTLQRYALGDYLVVLLNGTPSQVQYFALPYNHGETMWKTALYVQDQWTYKHLTLTGGLRFDQHKSAYDAVSLPATTYLPPRQFSGADVLNWKDLSPRLGVNYDVFGNGKTSVKFSLDKYVSAETIAIARAASPTVISTARLARTWTDLNGDFIPQGDPLNTALNGEIGPSTNANWGLPVTTLRYDPDWANGWNTRGHNWETQVSIQHEILPRVSVSGGYGRRQYGNFTVVDNLPVTASDYDPFCITAPMDSRLPGSGGQQICGLLDVTPTKVSALDRLQTLASSYGKQTEYWHGVDFSVDARLPNGLLLQGGLDTGRTVTDNCEILAVLPEVGPLGRPYCHQALPWIKNAKFLGSYMLPAKLQVAATVQSIPGNLVQANYVVRNAQIVSSLGRNLSTGANGTVTENAAVPGSLLSDRVNQIDVRLSRAFTFRSVKVRGMFDVYNLTNANPVIAWNNTYGLTGAGWLQPLQILSGRLAKFSAQLDF